MRVLIITDAWKPQVNGVVRTYEYIIPELEAAGHIVQLISPLDFPYTMPMPGYTEIRLVLRPYHRLAKLIASAQPDSIHIATEGPLGQAARKYCLRHKLPFNTAYHTQFPDYIAKRVAKYIPFSYTPVRALMLRWIRRFHNQSSGIMVATQGLRRALEDQKFRGPFFEVTRGVSVPPFSVDGIVAALPGMKRPFALYVGRVAIEKNIEAFLTMDWPGTKIIVGDGPARGALMEKFPDAHFAGKKTGDELASYYRASDIFAFPSKTDTFGMVLTEALSCGVPVAAYPVTGPKDIVDNQLFGSLNEDLAQAAQQALTAPGSRAERAARAQARYNWPHVGTQFITMMNATKIK